MKGTSPSRGRRSWVRGTVVPRWEVRNLINSLGKGKTMTIIAVGIDLAKHVFAVHGVDEAGRAALVRPSVARDKLVELIATLPPCLIGMEACTGAHHWARLFVQHGHTVRLIAPKFVTPYRLSGKRGKNDAADAQAICEAVQRPQMRFVPVKSEAQQAQLMVHCARQGFVKERTATLNRIRGLLAEFGHILAAKADIVLRQKHYEQRAAFELGQQIGAEFVAWLELVIDEQVLLEDARPDSEIACQRCHPAEAGSRAFRNLVIRMGTTDEDVIARNRRHASLPASALSSIVSERHRA